VIRFVSHSTGGTTQLERPQEVVGFLEVGTNREYLVDEVFHTDNVQGSKRLFDDLVVADRDALMVDLRESTLVDQITDGLQVWVSPSHERFHQSQHVQR